MKTYTQEEVERILLTTMLFVNANNNQGTTPIYGETFGDKMNTIIYHCINSNSATEAVSKLRTKPE